MLPIGLPLHGAPPFRPQGVMAEFALTLFASFLPTLIVMIIDNFFVLKANAWMQHRLQVPACKSCVVSGESMR